MRLTFCCLFLIVAATPGSAQTLILPHIADGAIGDGTRWATEIDLVNTSSQVQTARISFFKPDGSVRCFSFPRLETELQGCPNPVVVTLQPGKLRRPIIIDSAFASGVPVSTAWALIEGSGGVKAVLSFRRIAGAFDGKIMAEASFIAQNSSERVEFFPKTNLIAAGGQSDTNIVYVGLAIANPDPLSDAAGEVQLINSSSSEVAAQYPFTLPRLGQMARYLEELFGDAADNSCYARVVMTHGAVSVIGLRAVDTIISSIPPSP